MAEAPAHVEDARALAPLRTLAAIVREPSAPRELREADSAFFRGRGLSERDLAHMRGVDRERLLVYRDMVRGRLSKVIREWIPRTIRRLGRARYRLDFTAFMAEEAPRSRYIRCVPAEFVAFAIPRWRADASLPRYLPELARHELLNEDLRFSPDGGEPLTGHLMALDRPMRVDGAVRLVVYEHKVHELLAQDVEDDRAPERETTRLLAYRDRATHRVRYLLLSARGAAVVSQLIAGEPVQAALARASASLGQALDDDFLGELVPLLADLVEREVLLGAELDD